MALPKPTRKYAICDFRTILGLSSRQVPQGQLREAGGRSQVIDQLGYPHSYPFYVVGFCVTFCVFVFVKQSHVEKETDRKTGKKGLKILI